VAHTAAFYFTLEGPVGVFDVKPRKNGISHNPSEVSIPLGRAVRFKPSKELQSIE